MILTADIFSSGENCQLAEQDKCVKKHLMSAEKQGTKAMMYSYTESRSLPYSDSFKQSKSSHPIIPIIPDVKIKLILFIPHSVLC